jgi:subtilisin family serine protease
MSQPNPVAPSKIDPRLAMILSLEPETVSTAFMEYEARSDATPGPLNKLKALASKSDWRQARKKLSSLLSEHLSFDLDEKDARPAPRVSVLIKFSGDPRAFRGRLAALKIEVGSLAGDILTAYGSLEAIDALWRSDPAVVFIELSRFATQKLDRTVLQIGAQALHDNRPPYTGKGSVIGVVDMDGIDFYHPDFRKEDGTTRITHLWDQQIERSPSSPAGSTPAAWGYGVEYRAADIDEDLRGARPYDTVPHQPFIPAKGAPNHATHTAGVAAGNGRASKETTKDGWGKYTGVAPEAEIIYVNTFASGIMGLADLAEVCDAIAYIFDRAGERPCVVNLSLGDDLGPHDGTCLVEQFIDCILLEKPGRAVVIAAGNSNSTRQYAEVVVPEEGEVMIPFTVAAPTVDDEVMQIWYRSTDRLAVAVVAPGSAGRTRDFQPQEGVVAEALHGVRVSVVSSLNDGRNGDNVIEVLLQPRERPISTGEWALAVRRVAGWAAPAGETRCHAWIDGNTKLYDPQLTLAWSPEVAIKGRCTLTTPGTCKGAVTVGSYLVDGSFALSSTSGRGPTRDARRKPDLVAPGGNNVHAPLARHRTPEGREGGDYCPGTGTSQAAAHVSGLVALLFEMRGEQRLPADQTKLILQNGASKPAPQERRGPAPDDDNGLGAGFARAPSL